MDLLKKYLTIIFMVFAIFSANISLASSINPTIPKSDCGVDANVVKLFDGEICEQDMAFRMLYKMFPTTIEHLVFPIIKPEYLHLVPQHEEQNLHIYQTQELIFFEIFKSTNKIGFFIIGIFVTWHFLFLGLIRSANDGSFLGNSWKTSSVLTKYGILTFLLFPMSSTGILVIHVVLLSIIILGISFANYFWGVYLNYLQVGEDAIDISTTEDSVVDQKAEKGEEFEELTSRYDHNYFYAYSYAKELSKIALCKRRTEKLIFLGTMPFISDSNYSDVNSCLVNDVNAASWFEDTMVRNSTNHFAHYFNEQTAYNFSEKEEFGLFSSALKPKSDQRFYSTSRIEFKNKDYTQCQSTSNNKFTSQEYNCGTLKASIPEIPNGNIKIAINFSDFYSEYVKASNSVMSSNDPSSAVESSWSAVSNSIDRLFDNDQVLNNFKHNQSMIKKNVSYYFHQMLMNDAILGNVNYTMTKVDDQASLSTMSTQGNFNKLIEQYLSKADEIAKGIEHMACLRNAKLYKNANQAKKLLDSYAAGSPENISAYNTSCLDVTDFTVLGVDPIPLLEQDEKGEILDNKIESEYANAKDAAIDNLLALTETIRKKREAIEKSFYLSIINSPSNDMVNNLRKEGWAVSGGYMLKLLKEKELDGKLRKALQSSSVAKAVTLSNQMLPSLNTEEILKSSDAELFSEWMDLTPYTSSVLDATTLKPARNDLKYVDSASYLKTKIFDSMHKANNDDTGASDLLDMLFSANLVNEMKAVVGIDAKGELSMDQISECINPDKADNVDCPMNLTNPIIDITNLGHSLINMAIWLMLPAIMAGLAEIGVYAAIKMSGKYKNDGTLKSTSRTPDSGTDKATNEKEVKDGKLDKEKRYKGIGALENIASFLNVLARLLLLFAGFLLTVGFTLAYVIPLIPFIAFTIAFLSWVVISLEILIIAPIWLSFLFRIEDSNKPSTELYMAGFNFVMQMLFRPSLIVIAIVVGWSLFSVVFMAINFTMAAFIGIFNQSGFIMGLVYGILIIIAYSLVIYVAIKQIFDLMIVMPNKIFTKIGVQPLDSSFENRAKDQISNFTMAGIGSSKLMSGHISDKLEKSLDERKGMKKDLQDKMREERLKAAKEEREQAKKDDLEADKGDDKE